MMLLLGVLSVFQLSLLPGLLLIRLFPGKRSLIQQGMYLFMLSLLANYLGVLLLVTVGLYLRSVVLVLFGLEVALLIWLYRPQLRMVRGGWEKKIKTSVSAKLQSFSEWIKKDFWTAALYFVFGMVAVIGLLWVLSIWVANFNTVFQTWDAWASWDRWAVKWADNRIPGDTWEYPQLIPISYSVAYKFIGTTAVKFFGKSIMPLFAFAIGAMLFDLGRKFKSFGYMLAAGLALYSINLFLGEYIPEGYVDIPVACFSLMAVFTLLHARQVRSLPELKRTLLLGSLATAAAAVTKQPGLYLLAFYPLLAYWWLLRERKDFSLRESIVLLGKHFLIVLAVVAPWYALMEYRILFGGNVSNIQFVITDIYQGQALPERFIAAVDSLGSYAYFFVFALVSLVVLDHKFRQIVVLLVLPFSVLWAFFLSYEHRNLAVALPLLAMSVGVAVEAWIMRIRAALGKPRELRRPLFVFLGLGALLLAVGTLGVNDEALIQRQLNEQRQIFEASLNQKLYRYFSRADGPEPVITSYPIGWLPGLEQMWRLERYQEYSSYQQSLLTYKEANLLLVPLTDIDPRILAEVQQNITADVYQLIFTEAGYMLVRIPAR
ncbi:MAG: hypothetical protein WD740_04325 [Anaerolineales bacterium]